MRVSTTLSLLLVSLTALGGCATKDYGALAPLNAATELNDCTQVQAQVAEVERFRDDVERRSAFTGADVVAFLLDFGIGNAMAKDTAMKSVELRMNELRTRSEALHCPESRAMHASLPR
ncbi:MAG: hypothetical protein ACM3SS_07065 [Rhodospirillaceae bacterium]